MVNKFNGLIEPGRLACFDALVKKLETGEVYTRRNRIDGNAIGVKITQAVDGSKIHPTSLIFVGRLKIELVLGNAV